MMKNQVEQFKQKYQKDVHEDGGAKKPKAKLKESRMEKYRGPVHGGPLFWVKKSAMIRSGNWLN